MQSSKNVAIAALVELRFPLFTANLQQEFRRVQVKNSGPALHRENICEVAIDFSEELYSFVKNNAYFRFSDESKIICERGRLKLTEHSLESISKYCSKAYAYRNELLALEDDALDALIAEQDGLVGAAIQKEKFENDRYAFFSRSNALAEMEKWVRLPTWTAEEAVALSFGKSPDVVTEDSLKDYASHHLSLFCDQYFERYDLMRRSIAAGALDDTLSPKAFALWFRANGLTVDPSMQGQADPSDELSLLRAERDRLLIEIQSLKTNADEVAGKPSRITLYKMIVGMAVARFEHRTEKSSAATAAIQAALIDVQDSEGNLHKSKLSLSNEWIRKILTEAASELDFRWADEIKWRGTRRN